MPAVVAAAAAVRWPRARGALRVGASVLVVLVFAVQLVVNVGHTAGISLPRPIGAVAAALRLRQTWKMFAPNPSRNDGWFLFVGELASHREVDLFRGGAPVVRRKPACVGQMYRSSHWRKFMMNNARLKRGGAMARALAGWLCRSWNAEHTGDDRVVRLRIVFMRETTRRSFKRPTAHEEAFLEHRCAR
jgi:hypothetical protein